MNPTPLQHLISELKRHDEAATKGPWKRVEEYADEPYDCIIKEGESFYCMVAQCVIKDESGAHPQERADADSVAFLRNHCGKLAEMLEVATEALEKSLNPIAALCKEAETQGHQINGRAALEITADPAFYKEIARFALANINSIATRP